MNFLISSNMSAEKKGKVNCCWTRISLSQVSLILDISFWNFYSTIFFFKEQGSFRIKIKRGSMNTVSKNINISIILNLFAIHLVKRSTISFIDGKIAKYCKYFQNIWDYLINHRFDDRKDFTGSPDHWLLSIKAGLTHQRLVLGNSGVLESWGVICSILFFQDNDFLIPPESCVSNVYSVLLFLSPSQGFAFLMIPMTSFENTFQGFTSYPKIYSRTILM